MTKLHFFDPAYDLEIFHGDLPHWRQEGVAYFVTFRLADSLPQAQIQQLKDDRAAWTKMYKYKMGIISQRKIGTLTIIFFMIG